MAQNCFVEKEILKEIMKCRRELCQWVLYYYTIINKYSCTMRE